MLVRLGKLAEMPEEGEAREIIVGEQVFCVANVYGELRAMDNTCPHRGGALGQGIVEGRHIVCAWHGWQFDTESGHSMQNAALGIKTYPVKVEGDEVLIELSSADPQTL
jgi:nitrite reductase (NADH) small subunit